MVSVVGMAAGLFRRGERILRAGAGALVLLTILLAAPAQAVVIDFETDSGGTPLVAGNGQDIDTEFAGFGITLSTNNPLTNPLRLFNSNCLPGSCSGGDNDLATGASFGTPAQGNILIINETSGNTPDDNAGGGQIIFDFARPTTLNEIGLVDNDNAPGISLDVFKASSPASPAFTLLFNAVAQENTFLSFVFGPEFADVVRLAVNLPGSGAIAFLDVTPVPLPASWLLFISAVLAFGWFTRKRG